MSTIAWDGNILAADRQGTMDSHAILTTKLIIIKNKLFAWSGFHDCGLIMAQWVADGENKKDWPEFQKDEDDGVSLICIDLETKDIFMYGAHPIRQKVEDRFMAWGSGCHFAMGAMAHGATALQAIDIASNYDIHTGNGINFVDVSANNNKILTVNREYKLTP